jgi:RNA polymerase sigma-70 factor (ECF subfamily)
MEAVVLEPVASSPRERFESLFEAYARSIYRYFSRRAPLGECEDLTSEVFTTAWRRIAEIPDGLEEAWLYRTAWNVLANARRRHVDVPVDELDITGPDIADDVIGDAELKRAWQALSIRDREVLRLAAWEGLNGEALALALGISVSGAGVALHRARTRFEELLGERA